MLFLALLPARRASAATYTVTNTNDDGTGSLRWAITQANDHAGADTIPFNIPGDGVHTITPLTALPALTDDGTTIDGFSQNAAPSTKILIQIDGSATTNASGIIVSSANNTIRGLAINRFPVDGITIGLETATGNLIAGNHLGCDPSGMIDRGNGRNGVAIGLGAKNNIVGGDQASERNILSGNGWSGAEIHGSGTTGNTIIGNFMGTSSSGMAALGNTYYGVRVYGGAQNNTVGGDTDGEGNVISGNGVNGVHLAGTNTRGNIISGNVIGTTAAGTAAISNAENGVQIIDGAQNNLIGGDVHDERNIISGNLGYGIKINKTGTMNNTISGNYLGLAQAGSTALANQLGGVLIAEGAQNNTIGGDNGATEGNIISGNGAEGILITDGGTDGNIVAGNWIGTQANGVSALGNLQNGITINLAQNNTIGGETPGQRNVIAFNGGDGIALNNAAGNAISGNAIGTDATGALNLGNSANGVQLYAGSHDNVIGPGNRIYYNGAAGVRADGAATLANTITQNSIDANSGPGIQLSAGAHGSLAAPVITLQTRAGLLIHLQGTACASCAVEVFASPVAGGEGKYYLGSATASSSGGFTLTLTSLAYPFLTATSTKTSVGTSPFSAVYTGSVLFKTLLPLVQR